MKIQLPPWLHPRCAPPSVSASVKPKKAGAKTPATQLATEPPRNRDTNQRRERTPQLPPGQTPGTNRQRNEPNKSQSHRKTQTPTADQPPEPRKRKQPNGNGRRQRRPTERKNGLKDGSTRTKPQPHEPTEPAHRGTEQHRKQEKQ